jgi:hypothetical protein
MTHDLPHRGFVELPAPPGAFEQVTRRAKRTRVRRTSLVSATALAVLGLGAGTALALQTTGPSDALQVATPTATPSLSPTVEPEPTTSAPAPPASATPTAPSPTTTKGSPSASGKCSAASIGGDLKVPPSGISGIVCHDGWAVASYCLFSECTDSGHLLHVEAGTWVRKDAFLQDCLETFTNSGVPASTAVKFGYPACFPPSSPATWPPAASLTHGGTVYGVYLAVARTDADGSLPAGGRQKLDDAKAAAAAAGYQALEGLDCDSGAREGLGLDPQLSYGSAQVYFATAAQAEQFVAFYQPGVVGTARVQTYCMD